MNAALFLIIGCAVLVVGYIFYGGWLAKTVGRGQLPSDACSYHGGRQGLLSPPRLPS